MGGGASRATRLALASCLLLVAGCRMPVPSASAVPDEGAKPPPALPAFAAAPVAPERPARPAPPTSAAAVLDRRIAALGAGFRGDVGIAVRDLRTGWASDYRGLDYFPQQSVSKLWVALAAFDAVDRGALSLDKPVTVGRDDLTLFHQPIRALALKPGGFQTTLGDLVIQALTQSDNSANQAVLTQVGGPDAVRETLRRFSLTGIRFGDGERALQSRIAGLEWKPDYSIGDSFFAAREALPPAVRRAAFDAYVADPGDGATPLAMTDALARLRAGNLVAPSSAGRLLSIMGQTRTGPQRLKGALKPGWTLAHKTGTGQVLDGEQAGYNDVGVLTAPDGRAYAVAVLIGRTSTPLGERMALMQRVTDAVAAYDADLRTQEGTAAAAGAATAG